MNMNSKLLAVLLAVCTSVSAQAATTLFSEDFESGLGQWTNTSGLIVADPADPFSGNDVLKFTSLGSGGDIFTLNSFFDASQIYTISFDYLSAGRRNQPTNDLGGFAGIGDGKPGNHTWLAGTQASYPGLKQTLTHNGTWTTYTITFDANTEVFTHGGEAASGKPLYLFFEDFVGSSDGIAGNVYFDNILVTAVPEPETYAMMLAGLCLMGLVTRRRNRSV